MRLLFRPGHSGMVNADMTSQLSSAPFSATEQSPAKTPRLLRAVILYDDAAAYQYAIQTLVRVTAAPVDNVRALPWRFDALESSNGRVTAAFELAKSNLCVISISTMGQLPLAIKHWLLCVFGGLRGSPGLIIALAGNPDQCNQADPSNLHLLRRAADLAGWDFLTPEPSPLPLSS